MERAGFHVADREHYAEFLGRHPDFEAGARVTREWEIIERARRGQPDIERLRATERRLGDPTLWGALVADRRVFLGRHATFRQDYSSRFDQPRMLRILEEGIAALEALFDEVQPDVVLGFICVTFADYLGYLIARQRGIPLLNLRPTRVRNYVHLASSVFEPSESTRRAYEQRRGAPREDAPRATARRYLAEVRQGDARYEGVVAPGARPRRRPAAAALRLARRAWQRARDNHAPDPWALLWHRLVGGPWRRRCLARLQAAQALPPSSDYALFPLHTEPEVTLLVYSRWCLNQLEVIRQLAQSLPAGMQVLVKEHPAALGKRSPGYYRKLLAIPGVRLAEPDAASRPLVEGAALVATIAGSIGLEALARERPVLLFGHAPYEILPPSMVRRAPSPEHTAGAVRALLDAHRHNETALEDYIAAVIETSVPADLYSRLLGRQEAFRGDWQSRGDAREDQRALAQAVRGSLSVPRT